MHKQIVEIPRARIDEAAEVLAHAFEDDPVFAYFFPPGTPNRVIHLREAFRLACEMRFALGFAPLGCLRRGQLVGVACVVNPVDMPWPASLVEAFRSYEELVGPEVMHRFREYDRMSERLRPLRPHLYLEELGVVPQAQGQGFGRALLDAVQAMSEAHSPSEGVALETENPANLALYGHVGYAVRARAKLGPCDMWSMFRPNRTRRGTKQRSQPARHSGRKVRDS